MAHVQLDNCDILIIVVENICKYVILPMYLYVMYTIIHTDTEYSINKYFVSVLKQNVRTI